MTRISAFSSPGFHLQLRATVLGAALAAAFAPAALAQLSAPLPTPALPTSPARPVVFSGTGLAPAPAVSAPQRVDLEAESIEGRTDREVTFDRDVEIKRGSTIITAAHATYDVVEDRVGATGNIIMKRLGDVYTGDELNLKLEAGQGFVMRPTYRLGKNNAQGRADRIDFEAEDRAVVSDGTYSTCEATDPDWYLASNVLHLDTGRDVGTAGKTIVYFKGVPILGVPAMSFPLSDARKSGVLPPSIGTTNKGGLEVTVPYYFNIAPNRDLTIYPNVIARRGLQLGAEARYLGEGYQGETRMEVLPHDNLTGTNRYAIASAHSQVLAPGWMYNWNINAASDDDYPSDFSRTITTSSQRLLGRDLALGYDNGLWRMTARASNFQVLQDPAAPIARPYDRLPQINFNAAKMDDHGFDWSADAEITRFWHPDLIRGERLVVNPQISYPFLRQGYFVTPKVSFDLTKYQLQNVAPGSQLSYNRALPTVSLDSGLVFERETTFFGDKSLQTLEPRLFYVRTPYRDQSQLPNFDTAEADLSFSQLFSENRFIGHDRISDANQLTAALVTRFIEPSGEERLRFAVGQRFYFSKQLVTLGAASNDSRSDLLLSAQGSFTKTFSADTNIQYSESLRQLNRSNFGVHWQPQPKHILNVQYRRDLPNNLEQVDASAQWPIASRWYAVARFNYSLPDKKVVEGLLGAEYKADCWVFRMVGQRIPTATGKATSALFFQLELNGLTRLGSNPIDALRSSIPGYQLINQP
jgi:LPS-assembly protein